MSTMNTQLRAAAGKAPQRAAYPGLSQAMSAAADLVMKKQQPDPNRFHTRRHKFYHRVDYVTGGQASLSFFNVAPAKWICNLPLQGNLAQEQFFRLDAVRVWAETGITAAATYTRAAAGANIAGSAAAATGVTTTQVQLANAEELRTIFQGGMLTVNIGDKKPLDQIYSLNSFPQGGGSDVAAALAAASNSATTAFNYEASVVVNNGSPSVANVYSLNPPFPVLPGKVISATMEWQAALAITTAAIIRVELDGVLCSPANN